MRDPQSDSHVWIGLVATVLALSMWLLIPVRSQAMDAWCTPCTQRYKSEAERLNGTRWRVTNNQPSKNGREIETLNLDANKASTFAIPLGHDFYYKWGVRPGTELSIRASNKPLRDPVGPGVDHPRLEDFLIPDPRS